MAVVCVEICMNEDGTFSVGQCEPDSENLQPVEGGIKEALMQAAELLKGGEMGADAETPADESQEQAFTGGFDAIRGGGLGGRG